MFLIKRSALDGLVEPTITRIASLQSLTVHRWVGEKDSKTENPKAYYLESTADVGKFCAVNRTVNHVIINVDGSPWYENRKVDGDVHSLISIYNGWMANGNTSVQSCSLIVRRDDKENYKGLKMISRNYSEHLNLLTGRILCNSFIGLIMLHVKLE